MSETTVMSLRLAEELAKEIATVARVEGVTVSAAIYRYIAARRSDESFKKLLKERLEEDRRILERLGG